MKKKLTTADLDKWPQSQPLTPKPKQMHTMSTYGKGTVGNPYTWSEYVALGNAFIQGFVCDPENPDVATLLTMPYMGSSEQPYDNTNNDTYDNSDNYDNNPPQPDPNDTYNGFGEVWSLLTNKEREIIIESGVRLIKKTFNGRAGFNPSNNTIGVEYLNDLHVIKTELIHARQHMNGCLNVGYDKSVEYEQNITYFFDYTINQFSNAPAPEWILPEKQEDFLRWVHSCIKEGTTIDKGVFYSKINEFFQYFEYKVDGQIWEDTQPGYIPQWEELFEQLGIPFE